MNSCKKPKMCSERKKVKVLELFSGIGGMHYSLSRAKSVLNQIHSSGEKNQTSFDFEVVKAMDISEVANKVYKHNFPDVDSTSGNICGLKTAALMKLGVEAIFMSPPCQPFTRQGLKKDLQDTRTQPLIHLLKNVIPELSTLNYILLENVKGFEVSDARNLLVDTLSQNGFNFQEFLINPTDLGIPNSRLRYYLIAKRNPETFEFETRDEIWTTLSGFKGYDSVNDLLHVGRKRPLTEFIDPKNDKSELFQIPEKILSKYARIFDIVRSDSTNSCCFTKAYTKYAEGTGSIIQTIGDEEDLKKAFEVLKAGESTSVRAALAPIGLRYFSPIEIAHLLGFPAGKEETEGNFQFPEDFPENSSHAYKLLGNSLSVTTVAFLTVYLFLNTRK